MFLQIKLESVVGNREIFLHRLQVSGVNGIRSLVWENTLVS